MSGSQPHPPAGSESRELQIDARIQMQSCHKKEGEGKKEGRGRKLREGSDRGLGWGGGEPGELSSEARPPHSQGLQDDA